MRKRKQSLAERQAWMRARRLPETGPTQAESLEPHVSIPEIAEAWGISQDAAIRLFEGEPGVADFGMGRRKRRLRIPKSVVERVYRSRLNKTC